MWITPPVGYAVGADVETADVVPFDDELFVVVEEIVVEVEVDVTDAVEAIEVLDEDDEVLAVVSAKATDKRANTNEIGASIVLR